MNIRGAFSAQILGPVIFGFAYIRTVEIFPPAVFMLSALLAVLSFCVLLSVSMSAHVVPAIHDAEEQAGLLRDETLVVGE